ncbi:protein dachsous-like isoform X2 [Varroa destructor]|uniref:Cadherin domain-containing protein n=1 Tax=Varroa destructor TaxID=109461 RepID=A0A7M7KPM4_VARDE|nr:protein dachsous-like isoform X2 [Varroa destructor]
MNSAMAVMLAHDHVRTCWCLAEKLFLFKGFDLFHYITAVETRGLSTSTVVKVHVLDINDHRPKFLLDEYNVSLSEFFDQTTQPIVVVVATDRDTGLNGRVTYSIVEGNAQKRFRIDPSTGGIYITSALRRSSGGMTHHLVVTARDGQGVEAERPAHVHVHVSVIGAMSSNQQRTPVFDAPRYVFPVREDVTPHSVVGNVIARAADQGSHGVRYAIRSGNDQGLFTIDPIRGLISVEKTLDFETAASVLLNVQAAAGNPPAYGHAQVNISIEDVNDNNPCFESSEVRISVAENTSLSSPLYSAHAEDADSGENGRVTYALAEESDSFKVVARTGAIMLKRSLDYELRQQYRLILVARDGGQPTRTGNTTIIVEVQDVNDNAPVFEHESYRVTIDESLQLDEHFLQVVAADSDSGNNARITYRLVETESGGTISPRFGISPNTGQIFLRQRLDRESEESYELSVEAVDNGSPSLSAQALVHVTISDANDNEPQFLRDSFEFAVEENAEPGRRAGEAQAVDKDLGDNAALRYVLLSCDNEFYINPASGEMFTKMRLDREKRSSYECVVEARDQGSTPKSSRVSVRIRVLDKNDNAPQFIDNQETDFSVREEQPAGSEVAHVRATDSDEGANAEIVYEIEATGAPSDGAQLFSVNSDGLIRTKSVLDHEQQDMYTLRVVAKDMGSPSLEAKLDLTIKVQDVNDNQPSFFSSTISFTIQEGLPPGREVGVVEAFDQDKGQNGLITYTIVSGNPFNTFSIDRSNGVLYTNVEIDFERTPDFALQVSASDNNVMDSRGSVINVNIRVEDVNDNAPKFATDPIVFSVSESASPGSVLTTITARDEDSGLNGEVRYSIAEAGPGKQTFTIDPVSGAVTLIEPLDYEKQPQYVFVVKAQDQARDMESQLSSKATITLLVEDENDNSPEIVSKNYVEVLEDEDVGAVVTTILASDRDSRENGRITFRIQSGDIHGNFHLDENTGRLTIARRLDRELTQEIVLNITARDNGRSRRYTVQSLRVKIRDVNDCAPMFVQRSYYVNVTETKPIGSTLLRVSTKDNDVSGGSNVTYTLHQDPSIPFTVDAITGEVRITAVLDREQCDRYNLTIFTDDGATPVAHFDSANLIIDVLDANDHAPDFGESCYPLYIPENRGLSVIHRLHANDRDAGQNGDVIYNIAEGNDGNMFAIDPYSGSLSCKGLDRETLPVYRLTIHAQDQGVPPKIGRCNLEVHVLDQNDNDPQFEHSEYSAQVKEDAEIGTEVLMVKAHDIDEGANGKVTYSLINATGVPFGIDSETGHILTTGHFDREHEQSYTLEVRASDNGAYESRFHSATVHIAITDANDHKPVFIRYPFIAEISPDAPIGAKIERVVAEDDDDGQNADVSYTFSEQGLHNNLFNIDPYSGQVTLVQSVYNYNGKVLHVEIVASDRGEVPKSSLGVLEVHVGKTSHHQELHFEQEKYAAYILENPNYGAEITTIRAFNDLMSSQDITYSFDSDSDEFSINHSTGVVRVNNSLKLNYKQQQAITTIVIAKSIRNGEPSYGYARLQVNLRDKNDNTPRFSQTHYVASVAEGNRRGEVVVQLSAIDEDEEHGNGHVMYHIVDGNHDNAFAVDTSSPGVIRTNIVLDREIRDTYTLTVIATDEGLPPLTGTTTVHVSVVDVNDNQPVFPPYDPLKVREDKLVGGVVSVITANDVDAHPALVYNLRNSDNTFTIDAFSGQLTLARQLDFETQTNYSVTVMATDGAHTAETTVSVIVLDVNDHAPKFNESAYTAMLSSSSGGVILTVNATDADLSDNNRVTYKIRPKCEFLKINRKTGEISLREGVSLKPNVIAYLSVVAEDEGSPSFSTAVPLRIQTSSLLEKPYNFAEKSYSASILESAPIGSTVANLSTVDLHNGAKTAESKLSFDIYEGNEDGLFAIDSKGRVQTAGRLDRETQRHFELKVVAFPHRKREIINVTTVLAVDVNDVNDSPPVFSKSRYEILLSELTRVGTMILQVVAIDKDAESDVAYDITSGNEKGQFEIGNRTGNIVLLKELDFDATEEFRFIVRAIDLLNPALASLVGVSIKVKDENDNAPVFPVSRYNEFVQESAPVGSVVFTAHASDRDKGRYGALNYSILEADARDKFSINAESGLVTTNAVFDFESKKRYHFTVVAIDAGGKYAHAQVQVDIQGKDEYPPEFLKPVYHFTVPGNAPKGYGVGRVEATDVDGGSDGIVSYWLRSPTQPNFQVNATTGVIYVVEPISSPKRVVEIALTVEAGSGRTNSLTSLTTVQLTVDFSLNASLVTENLSESGVAAWIYALLILLGFALLILLSLMLFSKYRTLSKEANKPEAARGFEDTIDAMDARRYPNLTYPPHYNEISHYDTPDEAHMTTGYDKRCVSSRSADEDDEIRMINEGRMLNMTHRAHCGGEDATSVISAQNTQEYLARLGIYTGSEKSTQGDYAKIEGGDCDGMSNIIYEKLDDLDDQAVPQRGPPPVKMRQPPVAGSLSSIVHSEEEVAGSYNWDYLNDWSPQYHKLPNLFAEMAKISPVVGSGGDSGGPSGPPHPGYPMTALSSGDSSNGSRRSVIIERLPPTQQRPPPPPMPPAVVAAVANSAISTNMAPYPSAMTPSFDPCPPPTRSSEELSPVYDVSLMAGPHAHRMSLRSIVGSRAATLTRAAESDSEL